MQYYLKRVGQSALVLYLVTTTAFALFRLMPLGPFEIMKARIIDRMGAGAGEISPEQMERIEASIQAMTNIHPDQSMLEAYVSYMSAVLFHLDFGESYQMGRPVFELLFMRMPWSMFLSIYGLALGTTVALILGALMAHNEGSRFDQSLSIVTIINQTIPYYVVAIVLIVVMGWKLGWFPTQGRYDQIGTTPGLNYPFIASVIHHATLPILSTFVAGFGGALAYRGNCIREMGKGYIRMAELRGVSNSRIALRYIGRNALLPVYTAIMMGLSGLFGSSIILEQIFNYQAVGWITFQALQWRDYPLMMGAFIFFTMITLLGLLIADLTYGLIDPRVKGGAERESF